MYPCDGEGLLSLFEVTVLYAFGTVVTAQPQYNFNHKHE